MNKYLKIALWVVIAIAIISGGYLAYRYFFGAKSAIQNQTVVSNPSVPKEISELTVFDYWTSGNDIYYFTESGELHKINKEGRDLDLNSRATGNLSFIKPSVDGMSVLVSFGYPQNPTFAIYDTSKKNWLALPAGTTAAAWDPKSNNRLIYLKESGSANRLGIFTTSDGKTQELLRLSEKGLDLEWLPTNKIYFSERPSRQLLSSSWSYDLTNKIFKTVIRDEKDLLLKWSKDGQKAIKWSDGKLSLINQNSRFLGTTDLKTLPSKCAFSDSRIYCAAPSNQDGINPTSFTDDYLKKIVSPNDDFYFFSLLEVGKNSNLTSLLFFSSLELTNGIDADQLEIQNTRLLFINRHDGKLYSLEL